MQRISKSQKIRILSLGILCFQGFGIRIFDNVFPGAIAIWTILLFFLNFKSITRLNYSSWLKIIGILGFYFVFCVVKGVTPLPFLITAWFSAFFVLANYINNRSLFIDDFRIFCKICTYYSLLHIPIMLFLKDSLITTNFGMSPKTFLYLFYFTASGERIQGFCWEPSCWNLLINMNLAFSLYFKEGVKRNLLSVIAVISIMSTTGLVVMGLIILAFYLLNLKPSRIIGTLIMIIVFVMLLLPFISSELIDKVDSGSGQSRVGDFAIALAVMNNSPWLGVDLDNITSNVIAMKARSESWNVSGDYSGYMDQGMVNSFASLFVEWGIPLSILILSGLFATPLIKDVKLKILFFLTLVGVIIGTPITRTGFFYLFPFSCLLMSKLTNTCKYKK